MFLQFFTDGPNVFDLLSSTVGPGITKQRAARKRITAKCRLGISIRYLATGASYDTLSALFRVSSQSVTVNQVTAAIWACLKPLLFQDLDEEFWTGRIEEMSWEWDMEHCVGAIDDKLVTTQALPNNGSMVYDNKSQSHHSVHLQDIFDVYQRSILVDVGDAGRQSDGGVLRNSRMGQQFMNNEMNVPLATLSEQGGPELPK
ncbi:hypothetical protein QAD02_019171 [Eretmocerus hayati]|uniref:Uncharacterized protein n=1 Tax=Eretmocerus hayati TaxID=131215 RepID=A0ACC2PIF2_9HYME|nr:hypothetical protein QAD02_019171 [Eretmocerus hayati]